MRRGPFRLSTILVALLVAVAGLVAYGSRANAATPDPHGPMLARIDSLYRIGRADVATATIESLVTVARASGDRSLDAAMTARRSGVHMYFRRWPEALRDADHAIAISRARRDSLTWARALLSKARVLAFQERISEAARVYRTLQSVSRRLGRPALLGNARLGLAYVDLVALRFNRAEQGYRAAVRLLSDGVDVSGELSARVGLARTLRARGKPREAQALYREVIRRAIEVGDMRNQADAWNNMGAIEAEGGSRSSATAYFRRALECYQRMGAPTGTPVHNLALLLLDQHRYAEARDLIEAELARHDYPASSETGYRLRTRLASAIADLRKDVEAERLLTRQWATRDSVSQLAVAEAAFALARIYISVGRSDELLELMNQLLRLYGATLPADLRSSAMLNCSKAELDRGNLDAAFSWARRAQRELPTAPDNQRQAAANRVALARCFQRAGMGDSARAVALQVGADVDRLRLDQGSPEGAIAVGANVSDIALLTAQLMLDSTRAVPSAQRVTDAFDTVQRYKGRLYLRPGQHVVRASEVRRVALREGDVFLDLYWSPLDSTIAALALPRSGAPQAHFRAQPDQRVVFRLIGLYATRSAADEDLRRTGARTVLMRLLGPAFESVVAARRVYWAPPSWLSALPLAALLDDVRPDPARTVVLVPSASWLVHARRHPARMRAPAQVVRVGRSTDDQGRTMSALREESRWLEQRYGARGFLSTGDQPLDDALPWLGRGDVLHVAAHSRTPNGDPWESGLLLGRGDDEDAWLSMREISSRPACAPLVVLATCNATIGSVLGHESVYGIASGFLSAGARTVVSTLWDADDRTTSRFTRHFYGALEKGRTAGQALREAQSALAADPATRAPWYWAGFVLIGDPDLTVQLPRRGAGLLGSALAPLDNARVRP